MWTDTHTHTHARTTVPCLTCSVCNRQRFKDAVRKVVSKGISVWTRSQLKAKQLGLLMSLMTLASDGRPDELARLLASVRSVSVSVSLPPTLNLSLPLPPLPLTHSLIPGGWNQAD